MTTYPTLESIFDERFNTLYEIWDVLSPEQRQMFFVMCWDPEIEKELEDLGDLVART
jgi:hypothetical protein